ncbi:MAG: hypothetical protein HY744_13370 [Deltaproteobacteria bacterium]|nr:hypothetical protein [Deltaproteobacteria bacterium]
MILVTNRPLRSFVPAVVLLGCALALVTPGRRAEADPGATVAAAAPYGFSGAPVVALVATAPEGTQSSLYFVDPATAAGAAVAALRFSHRPTGSVRAEIVPGTRTVLVAAEAVAGRDRSFATALYRLDPGRGAIQLCTGVVYASRPLVTADGRIFVSRGRGGPDPAAGELRVDELGIDEIDLGSGAARRVHAFQGYVVHLAGASCGEIVVYRVGPGRADIVAVDRGSGALRSLVADLPPFARDFSVDEQRGKLVYRGRHETDARRWVIEEIDLASGTRARLYEGASFSLAPHVWPAQGAQAAVAFNPDGRGLRLLRSSDAVASPLGPGTDVVRSSSADGRFVVGEHFAAGKLPVAFVVDRPLGKARPLPVPEGARIAVAGFVEPARAGDAP